MDTTETKLCKHCQTEIPKKAKVCPNCKKKQSKKGWIIVAVIVIVIIAAATAGGNSDSSSSESKSETKPDTAEVKNETSITDDVAVDEEPVANEEPVTEEPEVEEPVVDEEVKEYVTCTAQDLVDALSQNALKASKTYKEQYIEVTGYFSTVDSSGDYFTINAGSDDWSMTNIQCFIEDDLVDTVAELTKEQPVTVRGYCSDVGEFLGYSIQVESVE